MAEDDGASTARPPVHPLVVRLGSYSWQLVGIGIVIWVSLQVLAALRLVVFPLAAAVLLSAALGPPAGWLRRRGWPPLAAAWVVFVAFLGMVGLAVILIVPPLADELGNVGTAVTEAVDSVETWLVEDSPFDLDRVRLEELEAQAASRIRQLISESGGVVLHTAVLALEVAAGILLALVTTFFLLKDGERFQQWALLRLPERHHQTARRAAVRAWQTLTGYLRGSAALGAVEAIVIGATLAITGGSLVLPVMVLTFVAAFVPFVGAISAGIVATAVALATAGPEAAVVVAVVALIVQQVDNDLLAPIVFGKALDLHPLVILTTVAAGASLAGIAGVFLAVPLTALIINASHEVVHPDGSETAADPLANEPPAESDV